MVPWLPSLCPPPLLSSFICLLLCSCFSFSSVFRLWLALLHSVASISERYLHQNQNVLAFWLTEWGFFGSAWRRGDSTVPLLPKVKRRKKNGGARVQVKGERGGGMDGRRECCGIGKCGRRKRERSELARQEWSVKEGEVEEKVRRGARE